MASASIGSIIFAIASFTIISILVLLLLRHYLPIRTTPAYLLFPVFLALALPSSIIILVPIDLATAENSLLKHESGGVWLPERVVLTTWRITYWLTFVLTWVMLPLLGEYCDSGARDPKARIIYSLRSNLRYQLIVLGLAVFGFTYFVWENGFNFASLRGLVMALAYAWGLFLAIGLMGHGLVTLPRRLFKTSRVSERLQRLYKRAPLAKEKLDDAREELDNLEHTVMQLKRRKNGISGDMQDWIDELADTCSLSELRPGTIPPVRSDVAPLPTVLTEKYLAELTRKLKRLRHKNARFENEWMRLCSTAQNTRSILDAASTQSLEFEHLYQPGSRARKLIDPRTRFYIHYYAVPYLSMGVAVFLAAASVGIVWSEITAAFNPRLSLIGITTLPSINGRFAIGNQIVAAAWLLYMCSTTLYALSDVKVWGNRALVKRQTYGESACWYALQVAKLTVPLSFNFITMMPARGLYEATSFYQLLGQYVNLTPLGKGFSLFFPCFIVVSALASLFNLYGRAQKFLGFNIITDDEQDDTNNVGTGGWREGKRLIEQEIQTNGRPGNVGLSIRGNSLDIERRAANTSRNERRAPHRNLNSITNEEEDDMDDSPRHFYQDLGERIRNTVDTTEAPQWFRNIGSNFKTPKWMQRDQQQHDDQGARGREGSAGISSFSTWLGGGSEDGQVRL